MRNLTFSLVAAALALVCPMERTAQAADYTVETAAAESPVAVPANLPLTIQSGRVADARPALVGEPISAGFVIVKGRVLKSPYRVSSRGRDVSINGELVAILAGSRSADAAGDRSDRGRVSPRSFVANLERRLSRDDGLIAFDERTRVITDVESATMLLESLVQAETVEQRVQVAFDAELESPEDATFGIPTWQWREALQDFQATDSLLGWVENSGFSTVADVDVDGTTGDGGQYSIAPFDPSNWMYALNVAGMLLVVCSAGSLPRYRPAPGVSWSQIIRSVEMEKIVMISIGLIVAHSLFDLVATLLATAGSGFLELNPFGSSLINNPVRMVVFKLAATLLAAGILWYRRHYSGAQQAAWWLCLVMTLLTVRWVAVQSMFYV